jgi:hypothetical protein
MLDVVERAAELGGGRQAARQAGLAEDAGQDVVEVVRDAAGEEPQALELLGVQQAALEIAGRVFDRDALGDVDDVAEEVGRRAGTIALDPREVVEPAIAAVAMADPVALVGPGRGPAGGALGDLAPDALGVVGVKQRAVADRAGERTRRRSIRRPR